MTPRQKPDAIGVARFLADLKKANWLGTARRWWPDYLFHFTDIQNAVSILKAGALHSRNEAQRLGLMTTDNASQEIIGSTDDKWKDYVRLYFRPRTPTQYRNEGFRPLEQRWQGAHCPVPIYFLFDSKAVLSRADSLATDGNLASNPNVFSAVPELKQIPFEYVYHDSSIPDDLKAQIIFHRHAEVIVPKQLGLGALRYIVCRSQAEYETLLHLLPKSTLMRWGSNILRDNQTRLFFKRWTYVESVELHSSHVVFYFNNAQQYQDQGTFQADVSVTDTLSGRDLGVWSDQEFMANDSFRLNLGGGPFLDYSVRLSLDRHITYTDRYQEDDLPW